MDFSLTSVNALLLSVVFLLTIDFSLCDLSSLSVNKPCGQCTCDSMSKTVRCIGDHITQVPQNLDRNISTLYIQDTSITELNVSSFSRYTLLTHLYIKRNNLLRRIGSLSFSHNMELTKLAIRHNPLLNDLSPDAFTGYFTGLRDLDLQNNSLTEFPKLGQLVIVGSTLEINLLLDNNPIENPTQLCDKVVSDSHSFSCRFLTVSIKNSLLKKFSRDILKGARLNVLNISYSGHLETIDSDTFLHIKSHLYALDLSHSPKLTTLPSAGLKDLRNLSFEDCPSLRTIPPTVDFVNIQKVTLTYPQHCCAFKRPELQDKAAYDKALRDYQEYRCKRDTNQQMTTPMSVPHSSSAEENDEEDSEDTTLAALVHFINKRSFEDGSFGEYVPLPYVPNAEDVITIAYSPEDDVTPFFNKDYTINPNINHNITFAANCTEIDFEQLRDQMTCTPEENAFTPCVDVFEDGDWLRILLWIVAVSAVVGNCNVLIFTLLSRANISKSRMTVTKFLICNLAFADCLLGIYLLSLAVIDIKSLGQYFNYATWWQYEGGCDGIGFLTVFASELSVFTLSVITMERWYAIRYAIHLTKRVKMKKAACIMAVGWIISLCLAMLPLPAFGFSSYQQTSLCLPFRYEEMKDKVYIALLLAYNIGAFILVFCCYVSIFCQVRGSNAAMASDTYLARRMALLVVTDFVCWGPVAIVAGLSAGGINLQESIITDQSSLYIAKIILVIFYPFNACINPFLYAIITKQFQKDCIMTLTKCGLCTSKARSIRNPFGTTDPSESQYSTYRNHNRNISNTTQSTLVTHHGDYNRLSVTSKSVSDPLCPATLTDIQNNNQIKNSLREYALKVFNHNAKLAHNKRRLTPPRNVGIPLDQSVAGTMSCSASTIDSMGSRRPSDAVRIPETLEEVDSKSYDDAWSSDKQFKWLNECQDDCKYHDGKIPEYDSGTELNNISESEAEDPLLQKTKPITEYEVISDAESDYRGRSTCDDDIVIVVCKNSSDIDEDNNIKMVLTTEDESSHLLGRNNIKNDQSRGRSLDSRREEIVIE